MSEHPTTPNSPAPGWSSRGYLPHFDAVGVVQHVTFHLADSLPAGAVGRVEQSLVDLPAARRSSERARRLHAWIDAGHGSCILAVPALARVVAECLRHGHGTRYELHAWVVMPNHVHAVLTCHPHVRLRQVVTTWKSYTGRRIAPVLFRSREATPVRRVWHREYWDRYVRDADHHDAAVAYVESNPVRAGLVARAEDWPWGSAHR